MHARTHSNVSAQNQQQTTTKQTALSKQSIQRGCGSRSEVNPKRSQSHNKNQKRSTEPSAETLAQAKFDICSKLTPHQNTAGCGATQSHPTAGMRCKVRCEQARAGASKRGAGVARHIRPAIDADADRGALVRKERRERRADVDRRKRATGVSRAQQRAVAGKQEHRLGRDVRGPCSAQACNRRRRSQCQWTRFKCCE